MEDIGAGVVVIGSTIHTIHSIRELLLCGPAQALE